MLSRPPRPAAAPPASPLRPAARPSGPPQTFLTGAPLRPSSMAPFPSRQRRGHGGARLRQSDSRGGAEAGRAVRGAARRTARTASAAARGGPRARRRRRLGVLVLPRSSLSGAPLSWLWRRPVTAAMAARGGLRTAASRGGTAPPRRPSSHRQRTARAQGPCKASWRASAAACARPRRTAASGGVRASARGHGERRRPRRLGRRGGRTAAARVTRAATMVSRSVATMVSWSVSWSASLTRCCVAHGWHARHELVIGVRGAEGEFGRRHRGAAWILVKWFTAIDSFRWWWMNLTSGVHLSVRRSA